MKLTRNMSRYELRKYKRNLKRFTKLRKYNDFEQIISVSDLNKGRKLSKKGVSWKVSVQRYCLRYYRRLLRTYNKLRNGISVHAGFIKFDLLERGKIRHISSVHFSERVVQRSLCDNCLVPALSRTLINDNGASLKGKGVSFHHKRLRRHIHEFFRHYNTGYILLMDFKSYFDNINHDKLIDMVKEVIWNPDILRLINQFVRPFGKKGLGLGSQICQILAIFYPNKIDHFIKEQKHCRWFSRYMDDSYVIHHSKEFLINLLESLKVKFNELDIVLNTNKTKIVKLTRSFTFLKVQYFITKTHKLIEKPCRASITRERRKLKKLVRFLDQGLMTIQQLVQQYNSWRGHIIRMNSHKSVLSMDKLFKSLLGGKQYGKALCYCG